MATQAQLRARTLVMVLVMVACANAGDLTLKRAMTETGGVTLSVQGLAHAVGLILETPLMWMAIAFMLSFLFTYMTVLSWADYSYVMPAAAFGYPLVTFLGMIFLRETVSPRRWCGVLLIFAGVLLVGETRPRTTPKSTPLERRRELRKTEVEP